MGAGGVIAALAIGGGAAFLILRRQAQAAPTPTAPTPTSTNACDSLPAGYARDMCNAVKSVGGIIEGIGDALSGTSTAEKAAEWYAKDAKNRQLNGEVEIPLLSAVRWCSTLDRTDVSDGKPPPGPHVNMYANQVRGTVARFANGCVPFVGAPGWEKCASGTEGMGGSAINAPMSMTGRIPRRPPGQFEGYDRKYRPGDRLSGYYDPTAQSNPKGVGEAYIPTCSFPIPIPPGHFGYFFRGKAFTCPVGKVPDFSTVQTGPVVAPPCKGGYVPAGSTPTVSDADRLAGYGILLSQIGSATLGGT